MPETVFEVLSQGMRYFFALLGVMLVWRAMAWQLAERRTRHRRLQRLPDAGMIGEMVVVRGCDDVAEGTTFPMPYEGTLGSARGSDLTLHCRGVVRRHLDFSFQSRCGVLLYVSPGQTCVLDGVTLNARSKPRQHPMVHGSVLEIGGCELRLRLFEGLETGKKRLPAKKADRAPSVDDTVRYVPPYAPPEERTAAAKPVKRRQGHAASSKE